MFQEESPKLERNTSDSGCFKTFCFSSATSRTDRVTSFKSESYHTSTAITHCTLGSPWDELITCEETNSEFGTVIEIILLETLNRHPIPYKPLEGDVGRILDTRLVEDRLRIPPEHPADRNENLPGDAFRPWTSV